MTNKHILKTIKIVFGEMVPFGDPYWYQDWRSPFYNQSHKKFRAAMREFVEKELMPYTHEWDEAKSIPQEVREKCFQAGWLPGVVGGKKIHNAKPLISIIISSIIISSIIK